MEEIEIGFPRVQAVPLVVAFIPVIIITMGFAASTPTLVGLGIFTPMSGILTYMVLRLVKVRWIARRDGLVFEGYVWRWFFPREKIAGVLMNPQTNMLRVFDADKGGRSIPMGTSFPTSRSVAQGNELSGQLSHLWGLLPTGTAAVRSAAAAGSILRTPRSESRTRVRAPGAWATTITVIAFELLVHILRAVA